MHIIDAYYRCILLTKIQVCVPRIRRVHTIRHGPIYIYIYIYIYICIYTYVYDICIYIYICMCLFQVFQVPSSSGPVGSGGIAYQIRLSSFKCLSHFEIAFSRWGAGWNVFARGTFRIHTLHSIMACNSSAERIGTWKNASQ